MDHGERCKMPKIRREKGSVGFSYQFWEYRCDVTSEGPEGKKRLCDSFLLIVIGCHNQGPILLEYLTHHLIE